VDHEGDTNRSQGLEVVRCQVRSCCIEEATETLDYRKACTMCRTRLGIGTFAGVPGGSDSRSVGDTNHRRRGLRDQMA